MVAVFFGKREKGKGKREKGKGEPCAGIGFEQRATGIGNRESGWADGSLKLVSSNGKQCRPTILFPCEEQL